MASRFVAVAALLAGGAEAAARHGGLRAAERAERRGAARQRAPDDMLKKPEAFAIQAPEGPNIFRPEALPVWMRPGAEGGGNAIGKASSTLDNGAAVAAAGSDRNKESRLRKKFALRQHHNGETSNSRDDNNYDHDNTGENHHDNDGDKGYNDKDGRRPHHSPEPQNHQTDLHDKFSKAGADDSSGDDGGGEETTGAGTEAAQIRLGVCRQRVCRPRTVTHLRRDHCRLHYLETLQLA